MMKEEIEKFERSFDEGRAELTPHAIKIAEIALSAYNGKLLKKALAISMAITNFEDELKHPKGD